MTPEQLDRMHVRFKALADRPNTKSIEHDFVEPGDAPSALSPAVRVTVVETAERIRAARKAGRPSILAFGAHTIKNGLGPVLIQLLEQGWLTHLATNGAGVIHDWEFGFQGESSEKVRENTTRGEFGNWRETGFYINLAIVVGAFHGLGYGASVGRFIQEGSLEIPSRAELVRVIRCGARERPVSEMVAPAADLLEQVDRFDLPAGQVCVRHPFRRYSVQAAAWRLGVPFTAHPMIGHDIIYNHPMNHGGAVGRAALRDFLAFAYSVSQLDGGVYMSVGSAVMSPMIFEKSMSMGQNLAIREGRHIDNHFMCVVDLSESTWDWSQGEPPMDHPDYYLRFYKTFHRMGGTLRYACADNRDFLLALCRELDPSAGT